LESLLAQYVLSHLIILEDLTCPKIIWEQPDLSRVKAYAEEDKKFYRFLQRNAFEPPDDWNPPPETAQPSAEAPSQTGTTPSTETSSVETLQKESTPQTPTTVSQQPTVEKSTPPSSTETTQPFAESQQKEESPSQTATTETESQQPAVEKATTDTSTETTQTSAEAPAANESFAPFVLGPLEEDRPMLEIPPPTLKDLPGPERIITPVQFLRFCEDPDTSEIIDNLMKHFEGYQMLDYPKFWAYQSGAAIRNIKHFTKKNVYIVSF
jgi:hypothetical protein